jgi:imidazole glycerol-phosphate synthase subunit HisH
MRSGITAIVDYGLCNIDSIARAFEELGAEVAKTTDPRVVERAARIVLPGVGAFPAAMANLNRHGLAGAIQTRVSQGNVPFLGVCLGMHLMASSGEEHGFQHGLSLVPGNVCRLQVQNRDERIPHIGWNEVVDLGGCPLLDGIPCGSDFYFVHSYRFSVADPAFEAARTPYCGGFTSIVTVPGKPIFGTQFHPEKSQKNGRRLLANFMLL